MVIIDGLAELWAETTGDPRVLVAVLDGPVDRGHPSLAGARLEVVGGSAGSGGPATRHGTAVASLIFGQHREGGAVLGIAPGCRGLVVPIFDDAGDPGDGSFRPYCSPIELARAIATAVEAGASIINISAGQFGEARSAGPILARAVARALGRGVLVVAAAGNDGCDCSQVPASLPGVLAVGAMDADGRPLSSSNWGGAYLASGLLAPGAGLVAATAGGGESLVAGTSFAAAFASGAAALLWSLALRLGRAPEGSGIRRILLDSALRCLDDATTCRRHLAGRLDLDRAVRRVRVEGVRMSDEFPMPPPTEGSSPAAVAAPSGPAMVAPSGCGCAACRAEAEARGEGALVFALGQVGFDLVSEARRDSIAQHMGGVGANPMDPARLLEYLEKNPWDAASVIWTLGADQAPLYTIRPSGPFARDVYEFLRQTLAEQVSGDVELVSIPGRLDGRARLFRGVELPVIVPEMRGMYSWSIASLIQQVVGDPPAKGAPKGDAEAYARKLAGVHGFLKKVYFELRNLGVAGEDRAINCAGTFAFAVGHLFEEALKDGMELDVIEVERSPVCRPESDCWDVKLFFFYPDRQVQTVRKVHRLTVDVSDVVPVTIGPPRSWFVR